MFDPLLFYFLSAARRRFLRRTEAAEIFFGRVRLTLGGCSRCLPHQYLFWVGWISVYLFYLCCCLFGHVCRKFTQLLDPCWQIQETSSSLQGHQTENSGGCVECARLAVILVWSRKHLCSDATGSKKPLIKGSCCWGDVFATHAFYSTFSWCLRSLRELCASSDCTLCIALAGMGPTALYLPRLPSGVRRGSRPSWCIWADLVKTRNFCCLSTLC